jgi:hypothetical protein
MGIRSSGCAAVDAMDRIRISGNVIPESWYKEILRDNGKPYLLAIILLSEIVYWDRPVDDRDDSSGCVIGLRKKFKGDLLQKSYEELSVKYGESKRTVKAALDRLESLGLIRKVFRDLKFKNGTKLFNVMFIEIFPDRIEEISHYDVDAPTTDQSYSEYEFIESRESDRPESETEKTSQAAQTADSAGGGTKFCMTPHNKMYDPLQKNVSPPPQECNQVIQNDVGHPTENVGTNTENTSEITEENTTKNTTEITSREYSQVKSLKGVNVDNSDNDDWMDRIDWSKPIKVTMQTPQHKVMTGQDKTDRDIYIEILKDQVEYDVLINDPVFSRYKETIDGIIVIIADIATTEPLDGYEVVNKRKYPHEVVKSRLLKMDYMTLTHVLDRLKKNTTEIRSLRNYLITALYNAKDEMDFSVDSEVRHDMYGGVW